MSPVLTIPWLTCCVPVNQPSDLRGSGDIRGYRLDQAAGLPTPSRSAGLGIKVMADEVH